MGRMERAMGEKRKGGSRASVRNARSSELPSRGTRESFSPRSRTGGDGAAGGRWSSSAQIIDLRERRRARRGQTSGATGRPSTGNAALTTGRRRLRVVAVAFALVGLLLAGRAVQMVVADGERYQAYAAEQGVGELPDAVQGRGSIVSADGRELATSLEAARIVATPYQI